MKSKGKRIQISWFQKSMYLRKAGIDFLPNKKNKKDLEKIDELENRINMIFDLVKTTKKATDKLFLVMYDIENNKVRHQIAKHLIKKGCIRIQKSVYLALMPHKKFSDLKNTFIEIQQMYENNDSIIIVPVSSDEVKAMDVIGKNINVSLFTDKPNTLFF